MSGIQISPDALLEVSIRLGRTHVLATSPTRLQVLVETRPNTRTSHATAPADIRLVVDVSGSMGQAAKPDAPSKLEIVKEAIQKLLAQLTDRDFILLSVFSTNGRLIVPQTRLSADARLSIQETIEKLRPEHKTNISSGLKLALDWSRRANALTRVILFTDGQSSFPQTDHARLVELADAARDRDIPLSIYGTGSDYNWSLLQQVAIRAGGGSFLKHVMDVTALEGHMIAELAFLRGTAIDRFEVEGLCAYGVILISATAMMPQIREIALTKACSFQDRTGALDLHRGAQFLVELEVNSPSPGEMKVLMLTLRGHNRHILQRFQHTLDVSVTFVTDATQESQVDVQVRKIMLMLAASKKAEKGAYSSLKTK